MTIEKPQFCRLEYLNQHGWWVGHSGINLLHPERYVERLAANGKVGRVVVIETGEIFEPDDIPDPSTLVPSETDIPRRFDAARACVLCNTRHPLPHDGSCLI